MSYETKKMKQYRFSSNSGRRIIVTDQMAISDSVAGQCSECVKGKAFSCSLVLVCQKHCLLEKSF